MANPPTPQQQPIGNQVIPGQAQTTPAPNIGGQKLDAAATPPPAVGIAQREHYRGGKLTREGMEHVLRNGGTVMLGGAPVRDLNALPSASDLSDTYAVNQRQLMEESINSGGKVWYQGRTLTAVEQLPSVSELTRDDDTRKQAADALRKRRQDLDDEIAKLDAKQQQAKPAAAAK